MSVTVTVESRKRDGTAFKDNTNKWHNYGFKGDLGPLPDDFKKGTEVELTDYNEKYSQFKSFSIIKVGEDYQGGSGAKKSYGGGYKEDPKKQALIVRQNALTNACNLIASGTFKAKTASDVLELMNELAEGVMNTGSAPQTQEAPQQAAPANQPVQQQGFDDEIPF